MGESDQDENAENLALGQVQAADGHLCVQMLVQTRIFEAQLKYISIRGSHLMEAQDKKTSGVPHESVLVFQSAHFMV